MPVFFALFISFIIVGNVANNSLKDQEEEKKKVNVNTNKIVEKIPAVLKNKEPSKIKPNKEIINEEVKLEKIKKELKPEPEKLETIKEELKPEPEKLDPINEELKPEPKKLDPINEEVKLKEIKKEISALDEPGTDWLRLALYGIGSIFVVAIGSYLYKRQSKNSSTSSTSDYMRKQFKDDSELDPTEQQPAEEEITSDPTEQQPAEEDDNNKK